MRLSGLILQSPLPMPDWPSDIWMWRMGHDALTVQLSGMLREQMLLSSRL